MQVLSRDLALVPGRVVGMWSPLTIFGIHVVHSARLSSLVVKPRGQHCSQDLHRTCYCAAAAKEPTLRNRARCTRELPEGMLH